MAGMKKLETNHLRCTTVKEQVRNAETKKSAPPGTTYAHKKPSENKRAMV